MITYQWEEAGVSRLHLGILELRQLTLSESYRRRPPLGGPLLWLLDDFRGSWIEPDPLAWLARIEACVATSLAGLSLQRHAIVLPRTMLEALADRLRTSGSAIVRLFDRADEARQWADENSASQSLAGACRENRRRHRSLHAMSSPASIRAAGIS